MIMGVRESATRRIAASQADVFGLVTDPGRLPAWNRAIAEVVEAPDHLEVGSVWKVRVHALGNSWVSRSEVAELDPAQGRFAYRSQTDDGNPSHADWQWTVRPGEDGEGSEVTVSVDLVPATFWRKHLLVKLRRPSLRAEMADSLRQLEAAIRGRTTPERPTGEETPRDTS